MKKRIAAILLILVLAVSTAMASSAGELDAQRLETYYALAMDAVNKEKYNTALEYLDKALNFCDETANPDMYAELRLKRGCVYTIRKEYSNALKELDDAIRVVPALADAYAVKMQIYNEKNEPGKTAEVLEQYITASGDISMYPTLAQMYMDNGDPENAARVYQAYTDSAQLEGPGGIFAVANFKLESGMYEEAIADYESCLSDPEYGKLASYNIAVIRLRMDDYENALSGFEACVDIADELDGIWYNIAVCNMSLGRYTEAIEAFGKSIDTESYKTDALYNRAVCCINAGQYGRAAEDLTGYLDLMTEAVRAAEENGTAAPEIPEDVYYFRAACYLSLEEYDKAEADYTECISRDYKADENLYNRAVTRLQGRKFEQAAEDFTECIGKKVNTEESYYYRSFAYLYMEDYKGAISDLNTLIARKYNLAQVYFQRAQVYLQMGDHDQYIKDLETSLRYN